MTALDLIAWSGGIELAGSAWLPDGEPRAAVLMYPGSGPADRHNDVVFPPLRDHLVGRGIAVASFDKRGVGGSAGDWQKVGLDVLATDAMAELEALMSRTGVAAQKVGLLGHSQGGWVALEAAAIDERVAFVVTHSGPGVGVWEQVRFSAGVALERTMAPASEVEAAAALLAEGMEIIREGLPWRRVRGTLG